MGQANSEVFIQTYKGTEREIEQQYQECAAILAKRGFYPAGQSSASGPSAPHVIAFGIFGLAARKHSLTVTYRKDRG